MKRLYIPVSNDEEIKSLKAGQEVLVSGRLFVARDAAHKRLFEMIQRGQDISINFKNGAIYYMGPCPEKPGEVIGPCGPTTAGRMDIYTPLMLELGVKVLIGKGKRSQQVKEAIKKHSSVYLATFGGAAVLIQSCVKSQRVVMFEELGAEAIREIEVEDLPCIVAVDSQGEDIYEIGPGKYAGNFK
ncbi:FumA C-terminus/TtdB family hydratase beta subunit [Caldicellulosiruptor morganii]|uniref:FumA C-terminus/TtdB family hydratase beta subunit n=1 Tax=Caldicellulosiruptor morganii TaxID=1387555 RepID=A0ABY7BN34_9FIRM|nr:FumA C-terminus/TtdB family hydratase beta subunit [Caldicellulosiruptor morganii]WAM34234.1 FumA C-terminus/TtdB family hydratase beta subunit [Caldicellulosiruptor morganii]